MSYGSYLLAEKLGGSGVLAAMTIGLYHRWRSPEILSPRTRIQSIAVWEFIVFLLNGLIFILIVNVVGNQDFVTPRAIDPVPIGIQQMHSALLL